MADLGNLDWEKGRRGRDGGPGSGQGWGWKLEVGWLRFWQLEVGCSREEGAKSKFWGIQQPGKIRLADLAERSELSVLFTQFLNSLFVFWHYSCGPFEQQWTYMSIKGGQGIIAL